MKFNVRYPESFSRGELLLRTLFGFIYIGLPHLFLMAFYGIWSSILTFIAFWSILFTGRYPQSFFEFQVGMQRWALRLNARIYNLADGYPSFGTDGTDEDTQFEMDYPESLSRGMALIRALFGIIYVILPHGFLLMFRSLATQVLTFLAFWAVLFTGKYPRSWFDFNVGTLRWNTRINLYMGYMTDTYPPFSGRPDDDDTGFPAAGNNSANAEPERTN